MKPSLIKTVERMGLGPKVARAYLGLLSIGSGSVQEIARAAKLQRTTVYDVLPELVSRNLCIESKKSGHTVYVAEPPEGLLASTEKNMQAFSAALPELKALAKTAQTDRPHIYFFSGAEGFKKLWQKIFASGISEYLIITSGESFLDFVNEGYVTGSIINEKMKRKISSRQIITDSRYARRILARDVSENRKSKLVPYAFKFPQTIIIFGSAIAFVSPRRENLIFVVESETLAATHKMLFDLLWGALQPPSLARD